MKPSVPSTTPECLGMRDCGGGDAQSHLENDVISVTPAHIKVPFEDLKTNVFTVSIWNKTKNLLRFRITPPQAEVFEVYCDQLSVYGQSEATLYVKCRPRETQIVVDSLELEVQGHPPLRLPLEILPSLEWFVLPKFLSLPATSLEKRVDALIGLPQPHGKTYQFSVVSPVTSEFNVEPRHGTIGGIDGVKHLVVSFTAHSYVTLVYTLRIKFLGIESQPYEINICGRCVPNLEAEKMNKDALNIEEAGAAVLMKPRKIRHPRHRLKAGTREEALVAELPKNSLDLFTPAGIMKFLAKKDDDPSALLGPLGVDMTKSLAIYRKKRDEFVAERFKYEVQQKSLAVQHHKEYVGAEPIESSPETIEQIKAEREHHWQEYQKAVGLSDNDSADLTRTELKKTNQRSIRNVGQFLEPRFNQGIDEARYLRELYEVKRAILAPFVNAARIIITRWRVDQRLKKIRKLVAHLRAGMAAEGAARSEVPTTANKSVELPSWRRQREYPTSLDFDVEKMRMKFRNQELKSQVDNLNAQLRTIRDVINEDLEKIKSRAQGQYQDEEDDSSYAENFRKFSHVQDMTTYLQRIDRAIHRLQSKFKSEEIGAEQRALTNYILLLMGLVTSEEPTEDAFKFLNKYMIAPPSPPLTALHALGQSPVTAVNTQENVVSPQLAVPPATAPTKATSLPVVSTSSATPAVIRAATVSDLTKVKGDMPSAVVTKDRAVVASNEKTASPPDAPPNTTESQDMRLLDLHDVMEDVNDAMWALETITRDPRLKTFQVRLNNIADGFQVAGKAPNYFTTKLGDRLGAVQPLEVLKISPQELDDNLRKVTTAIGNLQEKIQSPEVAEIQRDITENIQKLQGLPLTSKSTTSRIPQRAVKPSATAKGTPSEIRVLMQNVNEAIESLQQKLKSRELDEKQRQLNRILDMKDYETKLNREIRTSIDRAATLPAGDLDDSMNRINQVLDAVQVIIQEPRLAAEKHAFNEDIRFLTSPSKTNVIKKSTKPKLVAEKSASQLTLESIPKLRENLNKEMDNLYRKTTHPVVPIRQRMFNAILDNVTARPLVSPTDARVLRASRTATASELKKLEKMLQSPQIRQERQKILNIVDEDILKQKFPILSESETGISEGETDEDRSPRPDKTYSPQKFTADQIKTQLARANQRVAILQEYAKSPKIGAHIAKVNGLVEKALADEPEDRVTADLRAAKDIITREITRLSTLVAPNVAENLTLHGEKIKGEIDRVIGYHPADDSEVLHSRNVLRAELDVLRNRIEDLLVKDILSQLGSTIQEYTSRTLPQGQPQVKRLAELQNKLDFARFTPSQTATVHRIKSEIDQLSQSAPHLPPTRLQERRVSLKREINKLQYDVDEPHVKVILADLNQAVDEPPSLASPPASKIYDLYNQLFSLLPKPAAEEVKEKTDNALNAFMKATAQLDQQSEVLRRVEEQQTRLRSSIQEAQGLTKDESTQRILKELGKKVQGQKLDIEDIKALQKRLNEHFTRILLTSKDPRVTLYLKSLNKDMDETEKLRAEAAKYEAAKRRYLERRESLRKQIYGIRGTVPSMDARRVASELIGNLDTIEQAPSDSALVRAHRLRMRLNELLRMPKYTEPIIQSALEIVNDEIDKLLGRTERPLPSAHRSEPSLAQRWTPLPGAMPKAQKSESEPIQVHQPKKQIQTNRDISAIKAQLGRVNAELDALQKKIMNRAINKHQIRLNEIISMLLGEPSTFKPYMLDANVIQVVPSSVVLQQRERINEEIDRLQEKLGPVDLTPFKENLAIEIDRILGKIQDEDRARLSKLIIPRVQLPESELQEHRRSILEAIGALIDAIPGFDRSAKEALLAASVNHLFQKLGVTSLPSARAARPQRKPDWQKEKLDEHKKITDELFDMIGGDYDELLQRQMLALAQEEEEEEERERALHEEMEAAHARAQRIRMARLNKLQARINSQYAKLQNKLRNIDVYKNQLKLNRIIDRLAGRDPDDPDNFQPPPVTELKSKKSLKITEKTLRRLHVNVLIPIGSLLYQFPDEEVTKVENELNAIIRGLLKQVIPNITAKEVKGYMKKVQNALAKLKIKLPQFEAEDIEAAVQEVVDQTLEKVGATAADMLGEEKAPGEETSLADVGKDAERLAQAGEEEEEVTTDQEEEEAAEEEGDEEEEEGSSQFVGASEIERIRRSINTLLDTLQLKTYDPEVPKQKSMFNAQLDKVLGQGQEQGPVEKKDVIQVIGEINQAMEEFKEKLPEKRKETMDAFQDILTELQLRFPEIAGLEKPPAAQLTEVTKSQVTFDAKRKRKDKLKRKKKELKRIYSAPDLESPRHGKDEDREARGAVGIESGLSRKGSAEEEEDEYETGQEYTERTSSAERRYKRAESLKRTRSETGHIKGKHRQQEASKLEPLTLDKAAGHIHASKKFAVKTAKKLKSRQKFKSVDRSLSVSAKASAQEVVKAEEKRSESKDRLSKVPDEGPSATLPDEQLQEKWRRDKNYERKHLAGKSAERLRSRSTDKLAIPSKTKLKRKDKAGRKVQKLYSSEMLLPEDEFPEEVTSSFDLFPEDVEATEENSSLMSFEVAAARHLSRDEVLEYQDRINRALNEIQDEADLPAIAAVQDRFNEEVIDILNEPAMNLTGPDAGGILALLDASKKVFQLQDMARNPNLAGPAKALEQEIRKVATEVADVRGPLPPPFPGLDLDEHGHRLPVLVLRDFRQKIEKRFHKVPDKLLTDEIRKARDAITEFLKRLEEETPKDILENNLHKLNHEINLLQSKVTNTDVAHYQDSINAYVLYLLGMQFDPKLVNIKNVAFKPPGDIPLAVTPEEVMYYQKRIHCAFEGLPTYFKTAKLRAIYENLNNKITALTATVKQNRAKTYIDKYNNEIDIIQRHIMNGDLAKLQDELIEDFQAILNWTDVRWTPFRERTFTGVQMPRDLTPADTKKYKERLIIAYTDIPPDAKNSKTHDVHRRILSFLETLGNRPVSPEEYLVMETSELQEKITNEIRDIQNRMIMQVHQLDSPDQKLDVFKLNKFQWKINMELNAVRDHFCYEIRKFYEKVKHHPKKIKYRRTHLKTIKSLQENAVTNLLNLQEVINQFIDQFRKRFSDDAKEARRKKSRAAQKKGRKSKRVVVDPCAKYGLQCAKLTGSKSSRKSKSKCGLGGGICAMKVDSADIFSRELAGRFGISLPGSRTRVIDAWNVSTDRRMWVDNSAVVSNKPSLELSPSSVAVLQEAKARRKKM